MSSTELMLRRQLVAVGRRLFDEGLLTSTDGNLSARIGPRHVLITPAGVDKGSLRPGDLVVVDLDGRAQRRGRPPSTELPMHLEVYRQVLTARAVVHAHPPFATALTVAGLPFPRDVLPEVAATLGDVPVTALAMPGTSEDADVIRPFLADHQAILLRQHGSLTYGATLEEACHHLERIEHTARVFWLARSFGRVNRLPDDLVARLAAASRGAAAAGGPRRRLR
jgi:L-fuculose-phosphate aldolase